ncbi:MULTISPECIES: DUF2064 domain-containing protein [Halorhodospira]|uniref:TIGR04282 family arsenosugar biosynthesis glycosyltransferase n=1 Tax=Halorhodospira TaxID=85108 RepID=UPI001EE7D91E|nr:MULTISPECIES: DUF2064 domain-containing protein [Halorhodospira]MCG5528307.1 DUF2064 domain-containing protein [Halorhodospira halophila]MCG5544572.1 DUF2064 domain-containing protein [Halorhodospira sp. 9628]
MTAIALFVKTPGCSAVKTRLAAGLGRLEAERLYLRCAGAAAEAAQSAALGPVYWALAEPVAVAGGFWTGLPLLAQGEGELGERMGRVHDTLVRKHGRGILLGADAPQVSPEDLARAASWLEAEDARIVIGPARDGGFWLFGSNRTLPGQRWRAVPYSHPRTLAVFREVMAEQGSWLTLRPLTDLDEAADLVSVARELVGLDSPTPAQSALAEVLAAAAASGLEP